MAEPRGSALYGAVAFIIESPVHKMKPDVQASRWLGPVEVQNLRKLGSGCLRRRSRMWVPAGLMGIRWIRRSSSTSPVAQGRTEIGWQKMQGRRTPTRQHRDKFVPSVRITQPSVRHQNLSSNLIPKIRRQALAQLIAGVRRHASTSRSSSGLRFIELGPCRFGAVRRVSTGSRIGSIANILELHSLFPSRPVGRC